MALVSATARPTHPYATPRLYTEPECIEDGVGGLTLGRQRSKRD
ncbi:MAG: hypothetical protein U1G07_23045 [Verrucomicrobiota bacterium]